jgi:hypothetical protein
MLHEMYFCVPENIDFRVIDDYIKDNIDGSELARELRPFARYGL